MVRRRAILKSAVVLAAGRWAYPRLPPRPAGAAAPADRPPQPSPSTMPGSRARRASSPAIAYQASQDALPPAMAKLSYDQYQSLRFRTDHALWANAGLAFRLQFFHVGRSFTEPVRLYEIVDGQSREIVYDPAMFEFDKAGIDPEVDARPRGLRRLSRAVRDRLEGRRGRVSGRQLFSRGGRRYAAIRIVGARAGGGHGISASGGVSALHLFLVRAAGEGFGDYDAVRFDGLAERRRRAALSDRARRHAGSWTSTARCIRASRSSAWVWRRSPACSSTARTIGAGRTTGGRRSTIPTACRCGPAPANGSGGRSRIRRNCTSVPISTTTRADSACCSGTAISITIRTTACTTIAGRACGSNPSRTQRRLGQGLGAIGGDSDGG